jgi:predicted neuraminidase
VRAEQGDETVVVRRSRARQAFGAFALTLGLGPAGADPQSPSPAIVVSEFIYDRAPFPSAHASTIVETRQGLLAAWFGGTAEGHADVGIWCSRRVGTAWSAPVEVADGAQPDGKRHPCWNPVLFRPSAGPLLLFYKVGPSPREWWGLLRTSVDEGRTWSAPVRLPQGILGPIRAKPVELARGELLSGSSTEDAGWVVHMERLVVDAGPTSGGWTPEALASASAWHKVGPLNDPREFAAIQPTILMHSPTRLQILCRSRQGVITEAWSQDAGRTWSRMSATTLPNPSAGIDSLRLADGRFLLAYNPTTEGRQKLEIAVSDDGKTWRRGVVLEDARGEYSYPALIRSRDGRVHVTYTWQRQRIKHVVIDPARMD